MEGNNETGLNVSAEEGKSSKKCRRGRRKTFRPYYQLTEVEQRRREDKERRRVEKLMIEMAAKGRVIAPYNTTQFLISDHSDGGVGGDGQFYYEPSDEEDFLFKEFNKEYEQQQFDNLLMMNKEKLLLEYLDVAKKNEALEEKLGSLEEEEEKIKEMRKEMSLLKAQNVKLKRSNSTMKERIRKLSESQDTNSDSSIK